MMAYCYATNLLLNDSKLLLN